MTVHASSPGRAPNHPDRVDGDASLAADVWSNQVALPSGHLCFSSFGAQMKRILGDREYVRVQFQYPGRGVTDAGGHATPLASSQGCVYSSGVTVTCGPGFQHLIWSVRRDALTRKLTAMTGVPVMRPLEFRPALRLTEQSAQRLASVMTCTLRTFAGAADGVDAYVLIDLEQALMSALLTAGDHNWRHLLDREAPRSAPWQVRCIEEYIEANLDKRFDIGEAVALTGCSERTIYRAFRDARGYSPVFFSKQRRLYKARKILEDSAAPYSVTEVALACGFGDVSHFSRDYSKAFGETASATLRAKVGRG